MNNPPVLIRRANPTEIRSLRHAILRAGLPPETAIFPHDDDPTTRHFAAIDSGRIIGCVTLVLNEYESQPAWQLRGMAIATAHQRNGIGRKLLTAAEDSVRTDSPTQTLWCNARTPAAAFYQRHGWTIVSPEFEVPTAGPHDRMLKRLALIPSPSGRGSG